LAVCGGMNENHAGEEFDEAMEAAHERSGEPSLRDILKREHDEAQKRFRTEAWEKFLPTIEAQIDRERESMAKIIKSLDKSPVHGAPPKKYGPDMDME
jgi:hypothetical protein